MKAFFLENNEIVRESVLCNEHEELGIQLAVTALIDAGGDDQGEEMVRVSATDIDRFGLRCQICGAQTDDSVD